LQVSLSQMAVMVNVQLPADLTAEFESENVSEEMARFLVLELFRERKVSLGRAAELCSMPLAAFMKFSADRGVPRLYSRITVTAEVHSDVVIAGSNSQFRKVNF